MSVSVSASPVVLQSMSDNATAYVYAIVVDGIARYIGKGSGVRLKRARQHLRDARRLLRKRVDGARIFAVRADHELSKAMSCGAIITETVLAEGLTHDEAFAKEKELIAAARDGQLWNISGGGFGAGDVSTETRLRLSEIAKVRALRPGFKENCRKGWLNAPAAERKRFIDNSQAARLKPGYREAMSAQQKNRWKDPDKAAAMRAGLDRGRMAPHTKERHQKAWTPGRRVKHQARMRELWSDPKFRAKQSALLRRAARVEVAS